ncbi:hypothetical protein H0H93_009252 [Arthromyces matolae]|nr:hypothetical protein H0H93_009252 [Arthromyces matolae]
MPAPYNPSWSQPFTQQPPQMKEFDFDAHSGDLHSQNTYTFQQPQVQMPSGSGSTPAGLRANFNPSQQQQRQQARSGSYGDNTLPSGAFHHGYDPSTNQSQGLESFNPMYSSPSQDQVGWNESTPYTFAKPIPTNNDFDGQGFGLSTSPSAIQDTFPPTSQQQLPYSSSLSTPDPRMKRPRSIDDDLEADTSDAKEASKLKSQRSLQSMQKPESQIKREHLMNQIREQAAQIKDLMAQLESSENSPHRRGSSAVSDLASSSALQSPLLSPTSTHSSHAPHETSTVSPETNKAVEDWVAKAKQSFEEFDVFIGIGGPGMPKGYLVEDDLEKADSEEDDYVNISDHESDFEFAVEHHDGDEIHGNGTLKHHSSSSSLGTNGTGLPRKKHSGESAKPVILPGAEVPIGLLARMSLQASSKKRGTSAEPAEEEEDKTPGIANTNFFRSSMWLSHSSMKFAINNKLDVASTPQVMNKKLSSSIVLPLILARGLITPVEAEQLFKIYFDRMNLSVSLLDPVLYTAQRTIIRSPFLFTVICAIASRFYAQRPSLYAQAMLYAQQAAGTALITGQKNVEMCSAYILLSLYPVPAKRWEDQRSWLYLGLAIRTATDLNLHLPNTAKPQNENHARELLNRTRVWLNCFNLDRSTGSQHGKPPIINPADYMANHSEDWWKSSPHNMKNFDIHICAYNAELKVMANFIRQIYSDPHHPTGLNKNVDFEKIATETDDAIKQLGAKWSAILEQGAPDLTDPQESIPQHDENPSAFLAKSVTHRHSDIIKSNVCGSRSTGITGLDLLCFDARTTLN